MEADTQTVRVSINGSSASLAEPTVAAAMLHRGVPLDTRHVAVAVNDVVVPRAAWGSVVLTKGDRVEIITAVAGG